MPTHKKVEKAKGAGPSTRQIAVAKEAEKEAGDSNAAYRGGDTVHAKPMKKANARSAHTIQRTSRKWAQSDALIWTSQVDVRMTSRREVAGTADMRSRQIHV